MVLSNGDIAWGSSAIWIRANFTSFWAAIKTVKDTGTGSKIADKMRVWLACEAVIERGQDG